MQLFSNNAASTLASAITVGSTALTVFAGEGIKFPAPVAPDYALVTLYQKSGTTEINHEIVMVTARTGDVMTITRAQEGTTARAFNSGDAVELRWTAGSAGMLQEYPLSAVVGANVITANATPTLTAQAMTGTMWKLAAAGANTGAVTLNINGMGAVPVVLPDGSALLAGDILAAGYPCLLLKRVADFVLLNPAMPHGSGAALTGTAAGLTAGNATNATNANNATNSTTSTTQAVGNNSTAIATTAFCEAGFVNNDAGAGGVGTFIFGYLTGTSALAGATYAGGTVIASALIYDANIIQFSHTSGGNLLGTWRAMNSSGIGIATHAYATFQRIA